MAIEVWGTYSVRDHLAAQPWVADVLLYDRLVIPVPPREGTAEHKAEWQRWEAAGWQPGVQQELTQILGDRAVCVPWDASMQAFWRDLWEKERVASFLTGESRNPYLSTGSILVQMKRPSHVRAINAVATYRTLAWTPSALSGQAAGVSWSS